MGRTLLAVLVGMVVAVLTMTTVEFLSMQAWPPPPGLDLRSEADLARLVELASPAQKAAVVFGWALASFLGAYAAARLARRWQRGAALAIGGLVVAGVAFNAANIPHPVWMTALGVLLPVPLAWLASRLAGARS